MKKNKLKVFGLAILAFTSSISLAQQPLNSYFIQALPQAYNMNPGQMIEGKGYMAFPIFGQLNVGVGNTGFAFKDLLTSRSNPDGTSTLVLNLNEKFLNNLQTTNYLNLGLSKDVLSFGFKIKKKNYISINVTPKLIADVTYSKDLFSVLLLGNGDAQFADGTPISLKGTSYNLTAYNEYAVGFGRQINDKLNIGGRLKVLQGFANFNGNFDGISVQTSPNMIGSMVLKTDFALKSCIDTAGGFKNMGFALDLGGQYKVNEKITVSASVTDLGQIGWASDSAKTTTSKGSYTFNGFSLTQLQDKALGDTLMKQMKDSMAMTNKHETYTTNLPTRFFVGGKYQFTKVVSADALYSGKFLGGTMFSNVVVGVGIKAKKWFEGRVSYGYINGTYNNIGLATVFNLGAFQLYAVTDNVLGLFMVDYARSLSASVGINLTFGRIDSKKDKAKKAKKDAEKAKKEAKKENKDAKGDLKDAKEDIKKTDELNRETEQINKEADKLAPATPVQAPAETTPVETTPVETTPVVPTDTIVPVEGAAPAEGTQEAIPAETIQVVTPADGTTPGPEVVPATVPADVPSDIQGAPVTQ